MKKVTTIAMALAVSIGSAMACTVCKEQQPKILKGLTHGVGPDGNWDYLIVAVMVAVVSGTFLMSARYLVKPGEREQLHIKYSILNENSYGE